MKHEFGPLEPGKLSPIDNYFNHTKETMRKDRNCYDDESLSEMLEEASDTLEIPREGYEYSFIDAFRFLMKGKTIGFVNNGRKFKLVDDKIVEFMEFAGFTSKAMLKDKFYVGDE